MKVKDKDAQYTLQVLKPVHADKLWAILAPAALIEFGHRLYEAETETSQSIVYCIKCYAYTTSTGSGKVRLLREACPREAGKERQAQKSRLQACLHPQHNKGSISPSWPVRESAIRRLVELAAPCLTPTKGSRAKVGGAQAAETASLKEVLAAVGLDFDKATSTKPAVATAEKNDGSEEGPGHEVR